MDDAWWSAIVGIGVLILLAFLSLKILRGLCRLIVRVGSAPVKKKGGKVTAGIITDRQESYLDLLLDECGIDDEVAFIESKIDRRCSVSDLTIDEASLVIDALVKLKRKRRNTDADFEI